jgi:phospholipid/cholesterol/gamma-HCH transport system ATP-binding protein
VNAPLIRFEQITKSFDGNYLYRDLSLDVFRGEIITIFGGSGTGKSVLLKMLIGLLKPDSGAIWFEDTDVAPLAEPEMLPIRRRITMMFQGCALFDSMTVGENVAYPLRELGELSEGEIERRVREKLALVGLEEAEEKLPAELSGGMKKRVALARAIAGEPEVLLYDEPTTGLDPPNTRRISELIVALRDQLHVTSIVVTHDIASAFLVSDRIALLDEEKIRVALPAEEFRRSKDPTIREFVDAMALTKVVRREGAVR